MRIEVDCAQNAAAPTTKRFEVSADERRRRDDSRESTQSSASSTAGRDRKSSCPFATPMLPVVFLASSLVGGRESPGEPGGPACRATEDSEDDSSDSAGSTSDELSSQLRQLRFVRAGSDDDQLGERLVARGPPGPTAARSSGGDDSPEFSWFSAFQTIDVKTFGDILFLSLICVCIV